MVSTLVKIIFSSVLGSGVSCLIIFAGFLVTMLPGHMEDSTPIVGGAIVYYLVATTAVFLTLIALSPLYVLISRFGMANHLTLFAIGFLIVLVVYKFRMPADEIYFAVAGGIAYVLFHYGFTELFKS